MKKLNSGSASFFVLFPTQTCKKLVNPPFLSVKKFTRLVNPKSMLFLLDELNFNEISELRRALEKEAFILAVKNAGEAY